MKPIFMNTDMVRALLEGRKTVTRRVVKNKDVINNWDFENDGTPITYVDPATGDSYDASFPCLYQPGDILWVRETWGMASDLLGAVPGPVYMADYSNFELQKLREKGYRWKPSIHMPREIARIFLKVTGVRVERLQDLTLKDAEMEGIDPRRPMFTDFVHLWDSTIPKHPNKFKRYPYYWEDNPWVWVIEFEQISKEEATRLCHG